MSRITMCLEGNTEGRVLASFDLDEFANKVRADAIDEFYNRLLDNKNEINTSNYAWNYIELVAREISPFRHRNR